MANVEADYLMSMMRELDKVSKSFEEGEDIYDDFISMNEDGCIETKNGAFLSARLHDLKPDLVAEYEGLCEDKCNEFGVVEIARHGRHMSYEHVEHGSIFRLDVVATNNEPQFQLSIQDKVVFSGAIWQDEASHPVHHVNFFTIQECGVDELEDKKEHVLSTIVEVMIKELDPVIGAMKKAERHHEGNIAQDIEALVADFRKELHANQEVRPSFGPR
jgi:hypothetical protein